MAEVIGVRFKNLGKVYYFDPCGETLSAGEHVIVETARGVECGEVALANREIDDSQITQSLKPIIRVATPADLERQKNNAQKEVEAFAICQQKIAAHKLDMKLVGAEYTFDNSKVLFYFTADGRIDFRELVKDLASVFRTRIELRQIGVRDEAKMLGGLGICGRPFCCSQFLAGFQPVSIKMAKEQGLSLNPAKISGTCGRLMCCLKYEQEAYQELQRTTPPQGSYVQTPAGRGVVTDVSLIAGTLKVRLDDSSPDAAPQSFAVAQVKLLHGSSGPRPRPGKQPPTAAAKPAPAPTADATAPEAAPAASRPEQPEQPHRPREQRRRPPQQHRRPSQQKARGGHPPRGRKPAGQRPERQPRPRKKAPENSEQKSNG